MAMKGMRHDPNSRPPAHPNPPIIRKADTEKARVVQGLTTHGGTTRGTSIVHPVAKPRAARLTEDLPHARGRRR